MDADELNTWITERGPDAAAAKLRPFVSDRRAARIEKILEARLGSIGVAVEHPQDPHNAAAIVRTSEALGILHVHVIGAEGKALHASNTTQGAFHWLHTHHHDDLPGFLDQVRGSGMRLFGASMQGRLALHELPVDQPLCLLFGNESRGLSQAAESACDETFRIPMVGMSESLNLSVSAAISLYETSRARRASLGRASDLSDAERSFERALGYARSVDPRLLHGL